MGLRSPHLLLASSNSHKMLENLRHILDSAACSAIQDEIDENVRLLLKLGNSHHVFAKSLPKQHWRQRISRFYYGAYNVRRAVNLHKDGSYKTDVDDHKKTDIPQEIESFSTYQIRLRDLREDRNLADYDHTAVESDLILTQEEAERIVASFIADVEGYLGRRGIVL